MSAGCPIVGGLPLRRTRESDFHIAITQAVKLAVGVILDHKQLFRQHLCARQRFGVRWPVTALARTFRQRTVSIT